jgi:hypothetical protein
MSDSAEKEDTRRRVERQCSQGRNHRNHRRRSFSAEYNGICSRCQKKFKLMTLLHRIADHTPTNCVLVSNALSFDRRVFYKSRNK